MEISRIQCLPSNHKESHHTLIKVLLQVINSRVLLYNGSKCQLMIISYNFAVAAPRFLSICHRCIHSPPRFVWKQQLKMMILFFSSSLIFSLSNIFSNQVIMKRVYLLFLRYVDIFDKKVLCLQ